jgi:hypothetical protein
VLSIPAICFLTVFIIGQQSFSEALKQNWYHVIPGFLTIFFGIEIFKKTLIKELTTQKPWYAGFKFTMKLWFLEAFTNLVTNFIEALTRNSNGNIFIWLFYLTAVSVIFYALLAILSSIIVGSIIGTVWTRTNSENGKVL